MSLLKETTLLFVEDDLYLRKAMEKFLTHCCQRVLCAANGREALEIFAREEPDLVLTDIMMPEMDGIALTERLREISPETPVVLYSAFTDVPYLMRGIELGVAGFIPKPSEDKRLLAVLEKAALPIVQRRRLQKLESELQSSLQQMLGSGPRLTALAFQIAKVARTDMPVLIQGETGTGKSRLAGLIHGLSPLAKQPFIAVQLGAIPESLVISELFGHEKGAFTGAERRRTGLVAEAEGGTLFLDDIDTAPLAVQGMLLRLVEEKSYFPLGSTRKVEARVRILAATNKNITQEIAAGAFRHDLFYRLAGIVLDLPPLRSMPDDIPQLAERFLREACLELHSESLQLSPEVVALLQRYPWPGNIRQLRNVMRQLATLSDGAIDPGALEEILSPGALPQETAPFVATHPPSPPVDLPFDLASVERWAIERALHAAKGKKMVAARLLGMNYYTFRRHLVRCGLETATND